MTRILIIVVLFSLTACEYAAPSEPNPFYVGQQITFKDGQTGIVFKTYGNAVLVFSNGAETHFWDYELINIVDLEKSDD